jgi:hypothetical protein
MVTVADYDIYLILGRDSQIQFGGAKITDIPDELFKNFLGTQEQAILGSTCKEFSTFKISHVDALEYLIDKISNLLPNESSKAVMVKDNNMFTLETVFSISRKGVWMSNEIDKKQHQLIRIKVRGVPESNLREEIEDLLNKILKLYSTNDNIMLKLQSIKNHTTITPTTPPFEPVAANTVNSNSRVELPYLNTREITNLLVNGATQNEILVIIRDPKNPGNEQYYNLMRKVSVSRGAGCKKKPLSKHI